METVQVTTTEAPQAMPEVPLEPKVEPKVETKQEPVSDKFAALAKKDKYISKRSQEIAAQEKAVKDREARIEAKEKELQDLARLAEDDPEAAAEKIGLRYDRWTERILNKGKPSVETKIEKLERQLAEDRKRAEEEKEKSANEAKSTIEKQNAEVIENYKQSISEFVASKPEEYELLAFLDSKGLINAKELIFTGIQTVHRDKKVIPTTKEAADGVQAYLLEQLEGLISGVKYFKDKYGKPELVKPEEPKEGVSTTTITNTMSPGFGNPLPALTEEQRVQRALAAMQAAEGK